MPFGLLGLFRSPSRCKSCFASEVAARAEVRLYKSASAVLEAVQPPETTSGRLLALAESLRQKNMSTLKHETASMNSKSEAFASELFPVLTGAAQPGLERLNDYCDD